MTKVKLLKCYGETKGNEFTKDFEQSRGGGLDLERTKCKHNALYNKSKRKPIK
jgi:hypothetical protein